jgi:hypothetical protein
MLAGLKCAQFWRLQRLIFVEVLPFKPLAHWYMSLGLEWLHSMVEFNWLWQDLHYGRIAPVLVTSQSGSSRLHSAQRCAGPVRFSLGLVQVWNYEGLRTELGLDRGTEGLVKDRLRTGGPSETWDRTGPRGPRNKVGRCVQWKDGLTWTCQCSVHRHRLELVANCRWWLPQADAQHWETSISMHEVLYSINSSGRSLISLECSRNNSGGRASLACIVT